MSDLMFGLETKFMRIDGALVESDGRIDGYATHFGARDQSGDVVAPGAFAMSLARLAAEGRAVKMLWQHDPAEPIGVWDRVEEDGQGLRVSGRLIKDVQRGREALALLRAGAVDGLSIGYRAVRAERMDGGRRLIELDLWEVSLVTFPMLAQARAAEAPVAQTPAAAEPEDPVADALAEAFAAARDAI